MGSIGAIQRISGNEYLKPANMESLTREIRKQAAEAEKAPGKLERDYWYKHFDELLEKLNLTMEVCQVEFKREIHQGTGEIMVSVINRDTGEILRQVPPEKILNMLAELMKQLGREIDLHV